MKFCKTKIKGVYIITPEPKRDKRGYFLRAFCKKELKSARIDFNIVQANLSFTKKKGTIRGLHFQKPPHWEEKIVQCLRGRIYNVVLDVRKNSPTFGKWISTELSEKNKKMVLTPKGCANGFQALTDNCGLLYFMSEYYAPESASGVRWNDSAFNIKWPIKKIILSEKDKNRPHHIHYGKTSRHTNITKNKN